jgi:tetratricopeptide (TPR) repeat protein
LENWKSRAELCASLDAPKDEIEARRKIYDLEMKINGKESQPFAVAAESLGECELAAGNFRSAITHLREALALRQHLDLYNPKTNILMGYAYARTSRAQDAIREFQRALKSLSDSDPRLSALAYAMLADQVLVLGQEAKQNSRVFISEAETDYSRAEKIVAESGKMKSLLSEISLMRAYTDLSLGNYQEACALYGASLPFMEKQYAGQEDEMKAYLDAYSYCCFKTDDFLLALKLHDRANALAGELDKSSN